MKKIRIIYHEIIDSVIYTVFQNTDYWPTAFERLSIEQCDRCGNSMRIAEDTTEINISVNRPYIELEYPREYLRYVYCCNCVTISIKHEL